MNKRMLCLAIAMLPVLGGSAAAEICTIDAVPASTLLVPYFEVDLANPAGITTLFSVNSVATTPVVAHVTLWTDWSIPTLDFDVYLAAFEVQTFNLRDVFTTGRLPDSQPAPGAPQPPNCDFPIDDRGPLVIQSLQAAHTGGPVPSFGGLCAGQDYGDEIARGYVTIDQVERCSLLIATSPGYFGLGGVAGNENVLWGDVFYVDPGNDFAQGEMAVHVESAEPGFFTPGDYTFYGRYVAFSGVDQREPLGTQYGTRFLAGPPFDRSDILCWRDSKSDPSPRACNTGPPPPMPLSQVLAVAISESGCIELPPQPPPDSPQPPGTPGLVCPLETQRVSIPSANLPTSHAFGWIYLNLNTRTGSPVDPVAQAWVSSVVGAAGRYSVGFDALQICSACDPDQCQ